MLTKERELNALEERREANKDIKRVNNADLRAGSPMFFYCLVCGKPMVVPESYNTRPKLCSKCTILEDLGWLE